MTTFLAWLIANIKTPFYILMIIIYEILLWTGTIPCDNILKYSYLGVVALLAVGAFGGGLPVNSIWGNIYNILAIIAAYIVAIVFKWNSVFLWGAIPVLIIAISVAIFTATNMDEIVDMRMLFTSSNAEMFEITALYTFDRFIATLHIGAMITLFCDVMWYLCHLSEPIEKLFQ